VFENLSSCLTLIAEPWFIRFATIKRAMGRSTSGNGIYHAMQATHVRRAAKTTSRQYIIIRSSSIRS